MPGPTRHRRQQDTKKFRNCMANAPPDVTSQYYQQSLREFVGCFFFPNNLELKLYYKTLLEVI